MTDARTVAATPTPPRWDIGPLLSGDYRVAVPPLLSDLESRVQRLVDGSVGSAKAQRQLFMAELEGCYLHIDRVQTYFRLAQSADEANEALAAAARAAEVRVQAAVAQLEPLVDSLSAPRQPGTSPGSPPSAEHRGRGTLLKARERQQRYRLPEALRGYGHAMRAFIPDSFRAARLGSLSGLTFGGAPLRLQDVQTALASPDPKVRRAAWERGCEALVGREELHSSLFNGLVQFQLVEAQAQGAAGAEAVRHASNDIDTPVVDALAEGARAGYEPLAHRYFRWKARQLGGDTLAHADRLAPVGPVVNRRYQWREAKELVLEALEAFDGLCFELGKQFFARSWIDAEPRPGKNGGGFCLPGPADGNPYILVNFDGSARAVLELAHELGHGIHYCLARKQRAFGVEIPFTCAETAALFVEQLAWHRLVEKARSEAEAEALLNRRCHDFVNTVFRHLAMFDFESAVYREAAREPLSAARLRQLYGQTQCAALGDCFRPDDRLGLWYFTVPHFFRWPFYTYAYAFGELTAAALVQQFRPGSTRFGDDFRAFLSAGATVSCQEFLHGMGIDGLSPQSWYRQFAAFSRLLDRLGA